jgi:hypothetical protein
MPTITEDDLRARHDFEAAELLVASTVTAAIAGGGPSLLAFLARFVSWNGGFGAGVAGLAAKIGRSRSLFADPTEPLRAVADRSMHVASFFFDAARDEYDDSATPHRDSHRTLAQATLKGLVGWYKLELDAANRALTPPLWLIGLEDRTQQGYGLGSADDSPTTSSPSSTARCARRSRRWSSTSCAPAFTSPVRITPRSTGLASTPATAAAWRRSTSRGRSRGSKRRSSSCRLSTARTCASRCWRASTTSPGATRSSSSARWTVS